MWSAVASVVVVAQGTVLQCGSHCTCRDEEKPYKHDFTVHCDASTLHQATMTEEVLDVKHSLSRVTSPQALVTVKGGASLNLNVSKAFLQRCRQFALCHLNVKGAGRVVFPPSVPPVKEKRVEHDYVGIELTDVSVNEVPSGVFSGKSAAGLTLRNTTVGLLPAGLFSSVPALHHFHIFDSTVGVMEGPLAGPVLNTKMWEREEEPVKVIRSTVGLLGTEALHLRMESHQSVVLQGVSLGRVDSGALQVQGGREVVVEQCVAARVEAGAVLLQGRKTRLLLQDNWLALQPGALTQLPCGDNAHHMDNNLFTVLHNGVTTHVTLTTNQTAALPGAPPDEELAERERLTTILSTVIHPSCISFSPLPTAAPQAAVSDLTTGKIVQFSVISLLVGLVLGGLLLHCYVRWSRRRQSRTKQPASLQPVIMTQIPEDPIFRDHDSPPPVPPFPRLDVDDWTVSCAANGVGKSTEKQYEAMQSK